MFRKLLNQRPSMHLFSLVALICLYNLIVFQGPLLAYAMSVSEWDFYGAMQIGSLQVLQLGLLGAFLLLLAAFSQHLMKIVSVLFLMANASALYFMNTYNIEIDLALIGNILDTDTREVSELWHWMIWVYIGVFGAIPSLAIWFVRMRMPRVWLRLAAPFAVFGTLLALLFATSFTWLWYDQHATRMGGRILPWSYIVNVGRHYNKAALRDREQVLLPDATFLSEPAQKQIVVLVIGEAARAENFAHYGYPRDTNPYTMDTSIVVLPVGNSCATYTVGGTACITTHEGREAPARTTFEPLASYLTRHDVETIWRTNSSGTPPFTATVKQSAREIAEGCTDAVCPQANLDEALIYGLGDMLAASDADRIFVALHQTGSHGPSYYKKYPSDFAHFMPECRTVQVSKCTVDALYNAYDNTIRYTDFLLSELIAQLDAVPNAQAVMMYTSDHGQSLGEHGFYLHGTPPAVAPEQQRRVPYLVWMSQGFQNARGLSAADIIPDESFPHDFPFHSVMGAFEMRSDIYKPEYDIFAN